MSCGSIAAWRAQKTTCILFVFVSQRVLGVLLNSTWEAMHGAVHQMRDEDVCVRQEAGEPRSVQPGRTVSCLSFTTRGACGRRAGEMARRRASSHGAASFVPCASVKQRPPRRMRQSRERGSAGVQRTGVPCFVPHAPTRAAVRNASQTRTTAFSPSVVIAQERHSGSAHAHMTRAGSRERTVHARPCRRVRPVGAVSSRTRLPPPRTSGVI